MPETPRLPPRIAPGFDPATPAAAPDPPSATVPPPVPSEPRPAPHQPEVPRPRRSRWGLWLALAVLLVLVSPPLSVLALRWIPPPTTAFMLQSPVQPVDYRWVPAAQQPETLRLAVIASEDQKFWTHNGFDFEAIEAAMEHNEHSARKRGASTISQQVAKNLYLWPGRSWLRKGVEVSFTVLMEAWWTKQRILETYLNIAEFGPGVFGVEAAAQKFFQRPAAKLTPEQCARLAAVLPNPRKWHAENPGPYVQARTRWILGQIGFRPPQAEPEPPPELAPTAVNPDVSTQPLEPQAPPAEAIEPEQPDDLDADDLPRPQGDAPDSPPPEPPPPSEAPPRRDRLR